ncbi:hypothetical protein QTG54_015849 [Skeletonema marinoi]|uniref:RRM domain-containing protein n=1 Tax=Skeletonema marinoi TaxID=267567 RepID=A0AAD8XT99_9STRA|nr:hypothetical protein QTG54_015849 [Skeletonema marinoi]
MLRKILDTQLKTASASTSTTSCPVAAVSSVESTNEEEENTTRATMTALLNASIAQPTPSLTTLWVEGFDNNDDDEQDIRHHFRAFAPIVSVERPRDKQGNPRSHVFITLLSQYAPKAIEIMNGKWVYNDWHQLRVEKAKNQERMVAIAVARKGRRVCRAFCHGRCLRACPFGLDHVR